MRKHIMPASGLALPWRQTSKAAGVLVAILMVAAMLAPLAGRAEAADRPVRALFGTVVAISLPDTLTVATDSRVVQLLIPDSSVFTGDITAIEDISEGDRIVASAYEETDGTFTAQSLLVRPDLSKTVTKHLFGVIIDFTGATLLLQEDAGNTVSIDVPTGLSVPETGVVVTVVAQLDRGTGKLTARAFELAQDVVKRLQEAKDNAQTEEQRQALEKSLEDARNRLLSALANARVALQRARDALAGASPEERDAAEQRLQKVEAQFNAVLEQYQAAAAERDEQQPALLVPGIVQYDEEVWRQTAGTFTLASDDGQSMTFSWNENTMAVVPVESPSADTIDPQDPSLLRSVPVPLKDVKDRITNGSRVIVQHDPAGDPLLATVITLLPPELPPEIFAALAKERERSLSGFITLVEETPNLADTLGIIVLTERSTGVKVAAKISNFTAIEIDGRLATLADLAAGMAAEVEFNVVNVTEDTAGVFTVSGRLDAVTIRARTGVNPNEVNISGVIIGLDSDSRTVSIKPGVGKVVQAQATDDGVITKNGQQVAFNRLAVGDLVMDATRYDPSTMAMTNLAVLSQQVITFSGTISGMDLSPNRLTVTTAEGDVLTLYVTGETQVRSGEGDVLDFANLAIGDRVLKGAMQPVQQGGRTINVARELVVGQPRISTARGTVSAVDTAAGMITVLPPASTAGVIPDEIKLVISPDGRSLLARNGESITTLDTVQVGDIVESVSYYTSNSRILKLSVVSPSLQRVRGVVLTVDQGGLSVITPDARIVSVSIDSDTRITVNGQVVTDLADVQQGDTATQVVFVATEDDQDEGAAVRLTLLNQRTSNTPGSSTSGQGVGSAIAQALVETTISGVIKSIDGDAWVIGDYRFTVTTDTQLFGAEPAAGLVAKAILRSQRDGTFVAVAVSVAGNPDTNPTSRPVEISPVGPDGTSVTGSFRISGLVQSVDAGPDGTTVLDLDGVKVTLTSTTAVTGEAAKGKIAVATVSRTSDGAIVASSVAFTDAGGTPPPAGTGSGNTQPESGSNTGSTDTGDINQVIQIEVVVSRVDGRIMLGTDGKLYLLTALQAKDLKRGAVLTLRVRRVPRDSLLSVLSAFDIVTVKNNALFMETANARDNALYVAEPTPPTSSSSEPTAGGSTSAGVGGSGSDSSNSSTDSPTSTGTGKTDTRSGAA